MTEDDRGLVGAVDLGGTKILSLVVDGGGSVLGDDLRPTEAAGGPDVVLGRIESSLRSAMAAAGVPALSALGVASPGPIDLARGAVVGAPNLPGWRDVPVASWLSRRFGCPALLENDANAAAWGEFTFGAGRGTHHLIYLTISTGIGAGLILDGRLYRGRDGAAGEIGHIALVPDGPPCACGSSGCLEALASGTAIPRRLQEAIEAGTVPTLAAFAAGDKPSIELLVRAASHPDAAIRAEAGSVWQELGCHLGRGLAAIVNIFNPDAVVVGGGVLMTEQVRGYLLEPAIAQMRAHALKLSQQGVPFLRPALADRSGALGAAALARDLLR
jgi:glucokinase